MAPKMHPLGPILEIEYNEDEDIYFISILDNDISFSFSIFIYIILITILPLAKALLYNNSLISNNFKPSPFKLRRCYPPLYKIGKERSNLKPPI